MLLDLATRQDIDALKALLLDVLTKSAQPPASAAEELLSVEQVAAYTRFDPRTVRTWPREGRFDTQGRRVYLPAYEFSGQLRFKRSDVEAFGLGVGLLVPSLVPGQRPEAAKPAPVKPAKKRGPLDSRQALKVA